MSLNEKGRKEEKAREDASDFCFYVWGGILGVTSVTSVTNANFTAGLYVFHFFQKYLKYNKYIYIWAAGCLICLRMGLRNCVTFSVTLFGEMLQMALKMRRKSVTALQNGVKAFHGGVTALQNL